MFRLEGRRRQAGEARMRPVMSSTPGQNAKKLQEVRLADVGFGTGGARRLAESAILPLSSMAYLAT